MLPSAALQVRLEIGVVTHLLVHLQAITLTVGDDILSGADAPAGRYQQPQGANVSLSLKDVGEGERIFNSLAENGNVIMPFQKTFWSPGFGMCVDQFGIPWMVNTEQAG